MTARFLITSVIVSCVGVPLSAQDSRIDAEVARILPSVTELRHRIHENPELGNREFDTAAVVADHLSGLGFDDVRTGVAHTGVVAVLRGGRPGPVVAIRADMDALPVTEDTDLPFSSTKRTNYLGQEVGVMHACGHDIHTAVQLGVASVFKTMQSELAGTVVFLFQPAEEGPPPGEEGGAQLMLDEGVFDELQPEVVFGLHARAGLDVGGIEFTPGGALAAVDQFRITLHGSQTHGAAPHLGVDPVVMAAQTITALQTIRSRNLSPLAPSVITVGIVQGGARKRASRQCRRRSADRFEPPSRDRRPGGHRCEIQDGAPATIRFSAVPGQTFVGHVETVGIVPAEGVTTYPVTIEMDQSWDQLAGRSGAPPIRPGMAIEAEMSFGREGSEAHIVPASAVVADRGGTYVYVIESESGVSRAARRSVETGRLVAEGLQVLSGLTSGERVITAGLNQVEDGQPVCLLGAE